MTVLLGVATRLKLARLLLITDLRESRADLSEFVAAALGAGVDIVQLRDSVADAASLVEGFEQLRIVVQRHRRALLGAYESAGVAQRAGADLMQVAERGTPPAEARHRVHEYAMIGKSCHSRQEVDRALADSDIDYLMVGPVAGAMQFGGGLDLVRHAALNAPQSRPESKPWFAVGGITPANLDAVIDAGARRIAVSSAIAAADDPAAVAAALKERLDQAWQDDPGMESVTLDAFSARPDQTSPRPSPATLARGLRSQDGPRGLVADDG